MRATQVVSRCIRRPISSTSWQANATAQFTSATSDLIRRVWEHREGIVEGFTKKYGIKTLVYYEVFDDFGAAVHRENRLKKYKREWKVNLIQQKNAEWGDLFETLKG